MIDLNKIVNESLIKIEEEKYVEQVVEKRIKETLESVVDDCFRSYSDFGKNLKAEVEKSLNVNLSELDLASYNVLVLNTVKEKLDQVMYKQGVEQIKSDLDKLLSNTEEEYKLSEVINKLKEANIDEANEERWDEISIHVEKNRVLNFIYFDERPYKENYQCKYRIVTRPEDNSISSIQIDDKKLDNRLIMGGLHGIEEQLFKMYANKTKLILDDVDTEYSLDYED